MIFVSEQAGGKAGKDAGKAKAKAVSRSARAGLQVSRVESTPRERAWPSLSFSLYLAFALAMETTVCAESMVLRVPYGASCADARFSRSRRGRLSRRWREKYPGR